MTTRAARVGLVTLLLAASAAHAQTPARLCGRIGTDDTLRPIPPDAADAVNHAFGLNMPAPMITATTVYRCLDGKALVHRQAKRRFHPRLYRRPRHHLRLALQRNHPDRRPAHPIHGSARLYCPQLARVMIARKARP
jgi:hypothetical protein